MKRRRILRLAIRRAEQRLALAAHLSAWALHVRFEAGFDYWILRTDRRAKTLFLLRLRASGGRS